MNYDELNSWSMTLSKKDNSSFIVDGVEAKRMTKIRALLRAISDRCKIILKNNETSKRHTMEMEEYLRDLVKYGVSVPTKSDFVPQSNNKNEKR